VTTLPQQPTVSGKDELYSSPTMQEGWQMIAFPLTKLNTKLWNCREYSARHKLKLPMRKSFACKILVMKILGKETLDSGVLK
jgi:hypothetical protein